MSVRRLSDHQPSHFAFLADTRAKIDWWIAKYPAGRQASAVIPALWLVQKQDGWVSEPAIRAVAELLEMPFIRVYEVATFYTMFNLHPEGEYFIQVCGTTPCWLRGAEDIKAVCRERIGRQHQVTADGKFSWLEVECLGACCNAPMVQISTKSGDHYYEDLDRGRFSALLDALARGEAPPPGPTNGRKSSEPRGGATSLTDPALFDGSGARPLAKLPNALETTG